VSATHTHRKTTTAKRRIGICARKQAVANTANSTRPRTVTAMAVAIPTFRTTNTMPTVKRSVASAPLAQPVAHPIPNARTVSKAAAAAISVRALANWFASCR
jgi:hypothetical protein